MTGPAERPDRTRLIAAILLALAAVGLKFVVTRGSGGDLGYLSYVGAVVLGAWVAGLWGGVVTILICAVAEATLFTELFVSGGQVAVVEVARIALFVFDGALVTLITSGLRRASERERSARAESEAHLVSERAAAGDAERDRLALQRLQRVTASLAGAATPLEVADAILDRGLTALGAVAGGVSRLTADGIGLELIAARGYAEAEAQGGTVYPLDQPSHLADAVRTGRPVLIGTAAEWRERYPATPPRPLPESPSGGAIAVLPLVSGGRTLGTAVFRFAADRDFDDGTGQLAISLADQGAQALDRATTYEGELRARRALEHGQERLRFLAGASDRLGTGLDIRDRLVEVARLAVPALADWCAIELLDLDRPVLAVAADGEATALVERLAVVAPRSLGLWLAPGAAEHGAAVTAIDASWSERLTDPRAVETLSELGTRSCLVAPVIGDTGAPVGSIILAAATRDRFESDDLALVRDLAGRIGAAARQARLFGAVDRFKATVDMTADAVYMFDPDSLRLTYVNRGGGDLVGVAPEALLGASVLRLQPPAAEGVFRERVLGLRTGGGAATTFTSVLSRGDGSEIPVEAFLQEVSLPDGGTTAILTARDVSERIDVQARLTRIAGDERRQAAELRAVIQAMGEGILVVDPDGRVTLANDAATEILGDVPADLAEVATALHVGSFDRWIETGEHREDEGPNEPTALALPDGRWIEVAVYPADLGIHPLEGGRSSRIVVLRDVTRARDAEAAREAFLGVLSHELRTPVTTIFGYAKVLQRSGSRDDRAEMLADIEIEADRLYRIVEDLLALSRVEGGITIEGEPLLIQHLAGPVVESEALRWDRIRFETDLPAGLPAVFGERTYVEQVLRNMVSNAGKYSPPGTVVTVTASATPSEVLVRVLDRGAGIQPEESDRLFELYYRSPSTARNAAGAGIGLYVGRGLITAMGGRIWARPRPGGGSEFGFSLPRCDEDAVPTSADMGGSADAVGSSDSETDSAGSTAAAGAALSTDTAVP